MEEERPHSFKLDGSKLAAIMVALASFLVVIGKFVSAIDSDPKSDNFTLTLEEKVAVRNAGFILPEDKLASAPPSSRIEASNATTPVQLASTTGQEK